MLKGAIDECIPYLKDRKQFGKPLSSFQNTQFELADMQTKVDAARLLIYRAAMAKQDHEPTATWLLWVRCSLLRSLPT